MLWKQLNDISCKTYLIMQEGDNRVILVDPVITNVDNYLELLKTNEFVLTHVIDTHTHADHISAGPLLKEATMCEYMMHEKAPADCVTVRLHNGEELTVNGIPVKVFFTPGHTKDSISLLVNGHLFTGDALFLDDGGAARDDLPGGDSSDHWETLQFYKTLPEDLVVLPAHDYHDRAPSDLRQQKQTNPHLKVPSKEDFIKYIEEMKLGPADWMKDVLKANHSCTTDPQAAWIPQNNSACEVKASADADTADVSIEQISPIELIAKIDDASADVVLIDVREPQELKDELGYISGSLNIPLGSLTQRIPELEVYKEDELIIICRSGARAAAGAGILKKSGFDKVKILQGGMIHYRKKDR